MNHGEEVFCKFMFRAFMFTLVSLVENDESGARLVDDPLDELDSEPRKAVFVGNHNFLDQPALDVSQKPLQAFPLVVESGSDVSVHFVRRVPFLH